MDEIVKAALLKWPRVPQNFGWLALDARGDWYLRDEPTRAAGPFPQVKGSRIEHQGLRAFIARNYEADARGAWYFQNGPQRVHVQLEAAPFVWRLQSDGDGDACVITSHTGRDACFRSAWLDEHDRLFIDTDIGFGLVHSLDTGIAAAAIESGAWPPPGVMAFADMPSRFGHVLEPRPERIAEV
jgi:Protein of unknown function (DUF2946)